MIRRILILLGILNLSIGCSDENSKSREEPILIKDTFNVSVRDKIAENPILNDKSESPTVHFETKIPRADTNVYYGIDFDGDTIIYTEGNKILTEGTITGKFIEIQKGDYLHLTLKDSLGWYHNFLIFLKNHKKMEALWEEKSPPYMKKIRVHWKRENKYLEEARGKMLIYFVDEIKIL